MEQHGANYSELCETVLAVGPTCCIASSSSSSAYPACFLHRLSLPPARKCPADLSVSTSSCAAFPRHAAPAWQCWCIAWRLKIRPEHTTPCQDQSTNTASVMTDDYRSPSSTLQSGQKSGSEISRGSRAKSLPLSSFPRATLLVRVLQTGLDNLAHLHGKHQAVSVSEKLPGAGGQVVTRSCPPTLLSSLPAETVSSKPFLAEYKHHKSPPLRVCRLMHMHPPTPVHDRTRTCTQHLPSAL